MKVKVTVITLLVTLWVTGITFAGVLNWLPTDITPIGDDTVRVYGLHYTVTPGTTYNVDFKFNETTLKFEPILPASVVTINEAKVATADAQRGGRLYDTWWKVNGQAKPMGNYPGYPTIGQQSGAATYRCKECHGWDYKGKDGAYSSGSHFTGIKGVYEARNLNAAHIFTLIAAHELSLSEQDIWDLTRFIREGLVEMDKYIIFTGMQRKATTGDATSGKAVYENTGPSGGQCSMCHGTDGKAILFHEGTEALGDVASDNPWETLHKLRNGQPGTGMPSAVKNGLSIDDQINILAYGQTLPMLGH